MRNPRFIAAAFRTLGLFLVGVLLIPSLLEAQGRGNGPPSGPPGPPFEPPGPPPFVHDRSGPPGPPPGRPPDHSNSRLLRSGMTPEMVAAVGFAAAEVQTSLASGSLTTLSGQPIPPVAQRHLLQLFSGGVGAEMAGFVAALGSGGDPSTRSAARELTERVRGIGEDPAGLGEAVASYNHFIDVSPVQLLQEPPPELLALQSALGTMVDAAFEAVEESGASGAEQE